MKHIFIVNPMSGKEDSTERIQRELRRFEGRLDYELYRTRAPGDATEYIRERIRREPDAAMRFYACGGDGTVNEVANGVCGAKKASFSVYPVGSGNDFVKYFGGAKRFFDLEKLVQGEETVIDAMDAGGRIAVNVVNLGLDSHVCMTMIKVKRKPIIGGKNAYYTGVVSGILCAMRTACHITIDGEEIPLQKILLCTLANGDYVGGSFKCAPRAKVDDGLIELCAVKPISRLRFPILMGPYTRGEHLDDPRFRSIVTYRQGKEIRITGEKPLWICVDGEMVQSADMTVRILPGVLRFAVPKE